MQTQTSTILAALVLCSLTFLGTCHADEAVLPVEQGLRLLTTTSYRLVKCLPDSEAVVPADKLAKLTAEFERTLSGGRIPTDIELRRLRHWVIQFHGMGAAHYPPASPDGLRFTGNLSLAKGYLDCAIRLAATER